ncbi:lysostaphin resistance A-like protein [Actinomycetes bacterium M1A6_2h]
MQSASSGLPPVTGRDILWAFLGGVVGLVTGALIEYTLSGHTSVGPLSLLVAYVGGFAGLYVGLSRWRLWTLSDLGFCSPVHNLLHLLWQVPVLMLLALGATAAVEALVGIAPSADTNSMVTDAAELGPASAIGVLVLVTILVPPIEEIVFRRLLLDWLTSKLPTWLAAVLCTVVFALSHVEPAAMVYILFLASGLWASALVPDTVGIRDHALGEQSHGRLARHSVGGRLNGELVRVGDRHPHRASE